MAEGRGERIRNGRLAQGPRQRVGYPTGVRWHWQQAEAAAASSPPLSSFLSLFYYYYLSSRAASVHSPCD
jgi:hypothetical protein